MLDNAPDSEAPPNEPKSSVRWIYYLIYVGLIILGLVGGIYLGNLRNNNPTPHAPNFSFTLYQGAERLGAKDLELSDLKGKPLVLNFWAGLCPPCRAEMDDLQIFNDRYSEKVTTLGIDLGQYLGLGSNEDALALLEDMNLTYPAGFTEDTTVIEKYQVLYIPTTMFINSDGTIFRTWAGLLDEQVLVEISSEMLGDQMERSAN